MKKIICFLLTVLTGLTCFLPYASATGAMLADSVPPPVIASCKAAGSDTDITYKIVFSSSVASCEAVREAYLAKTSETYSEEEILHSDVSWLLYRTRTFCEVCVSGKAYLIEKPIKSTSSATLSLFGDILPALKKGGFPLSANTPGFDFSLRLITASENYPDKPETVFACSAPSEEKSFSCPAFCFIDYDITDDTDMTNAAPAFLFAPVTKDLPLGIPARTGYTFAGWCKPNGYYTEVFSAGDKYLAVTPEWIPKSFAVNYVIATDIHFNFGRADNRANPTRYTVGIPEPLYDLKTPVGGYVFDGWYDNRAFLGEKLTEVSGRTGDIILYAKWISDEDREAREHGTNDEYAATFRYGDADLDGTLTVEDARLVLRASVGLETLSEEALRRADILGTGGPDPAGARKILRIVTGLDSLYDTLITYDRIKPR